jgi:decaprenylphospho-beta-D-ribofuranose 2-oxidase
MQRVDAPPVETDARIVGGFGGGAQARVLLARPADADDVAAAVAWWRSVGSAERPEGMIARGLGRSYGDAAHVSGGLVLEMNRLRGFQLDRGSGTVTASAGVTIGELLAGLVPAGWMLPVVPGTQHVTVGGAIASDVHGKNHPSAGSFGMHVQTLGLLSAAGEITELDPGDELFAATLGGMGLTGVILWARIGLARVASDQVAVDTDRVRCLDDALDLLAAPSTATHRIAWLDLLASNPGRGIVTRSEHIPEGHGDATAYAQLDASLTVPVRWPAGLLRGATVRAFNALRYRRAPRRERGRPQRLAAHLFPLDSLNRWPRLYGSQGLLQYQFVIPSGQERVLEEAISRLAGARVPCFLATLKALGGPSVGPLSFPLAGWTLAVDLPRAAVGAGEVLDSLDGLVARAGGRVYLTKDARLRADAVRSMYPELAAWQGVRDRADPDRVWRSDLAARTGLVPSGGR